MITWSSFFLIPIGTADFISTYPAFVGNVSQVKNVECNKDTGGLKTLHCWSHCWSRGIFFIVSAGGHIEYWQPLYRYILSLWVEKF